MSLLDTEDDECFQQFSLQEAVGSITYNVRIKLIIVGYRIVETLFHNKLYFYLLGGSNRCICYWVQV
jgi:hypothetical protein